MLIQKGLAASLLDQSLFSLMKVINAAKWGSLMYDIVRIRDHYPYACVSECCCFYIRKIMQAFPVQTDIE